MLHIGPLIGVGATRRLSDVVLAGPKVSALSVDPFRDAIDAATLSWSTDAGEGTAYWLVDATARDAAFVRANGAPIAVTAAGAQAALETAGLTAGGAYQFHLLHEDLAGDGALARIAFTMPPVDVFPIGGQSNAIGRGTFDGGPTHPSGVWEWTAAAVAPSSPLAGHIDEIAGDMGFDVQFAIDYRAANAARKILFVARADGATGFGDGTWTPGGAGYDAWRDAINAAVVGAPGAAVRAFLWHQGEDDIGDAGYAAALDGLIAAIRSETATADATTPFVLGGLSPSWIAASDTAARTAINDAIAATPGRVAYTAVVDASDLAEASDIIHFEAANLRLLGTRYASAIAVAEANAPSTPAAIADLSASPSDGLVVLSWTAPATGGSPLTDYAVEVSTVSASGPWTQLADGVSTETGATHAGLTNGATYFYRAAAVNAVGQGPMSAAVSAAPTAAAGPAFVSATGAEVASGSGVVSVAMPTGLAPGDVVIGAAASDGGLGDDEAFDAAVGWTEIHNPGGGQPGAQVFYKVMGAVPDTTVDIGREQTGQPTAVALYACRGIHADVIDVAVPAAATGTSGLPQPPAVTTASDNALLVLIGLLDDDNDAANTTAPAGATHLVAQGAGTPGATANAATVMIASQLADTAGTHSPGAFSGLGSDVWAALTIPLKPA